MGAGAGPGPAVLCVGHCPARSWGRCCLSRPGLLAPGLPAPCLRLCSTHCCSSGALPLKTGFSAALLRTVGTPNKWRFSLLILVMLELVALYPTPGAVQKWFQANHSRAR